VLLAAVYKSPGKAWRDADITELLSFRRKSILTGDLNAKHPFWNSRISNPSGEKLLDLFDRNDFEILAPQCPTHYSHVGNSDVLDIVVHKNIRVSDVIVSDILDSDHLPIVFHMKRSVFCAQFLVSNSSMSLITALRPGRPGNRGSVPGRGKIFVSSPQRPDLLWNSPSVPWGKGQLVHKPDVTAIFEPIV
jgi:hypothetical protein